MPTPECDKTRTIAWHNGSSFENLEPIIPRFSRNDFHNLSANKKTAQWMRRFVFLVLHGKPKFRDINNIRLNIRLHLFSAMPLSAGTVERRGVHGVEIDAIEAAHVDRRHFRTVGHLAKSKRFDTAFCAELVMNHMLVEKIFPIRIGTRCLR
ncbi:hypothetical protein [Pandoraea pneumonica]|uniref:hypothetical protein n=1 Tax=Pandoraea pneumonica TaxID=2508299 RepID=UPI003CED6CC4